MVKLPFVIIFAVAALIVGYALSVMVEKRALKKEAEKIVQNNNLEVV